MSEYFSIVVDIKDPQLDVFLAFPFQMEEVVELVDEAVRKSELVPYRVDFERLGTSFVDDIVTRTRGARMVIGICTPEPDTGKPNPNVMYELGLADSLGKTTLAITTDPTTLPADIRGNRAFAYTQKEIENPQSSQGLVNRLRAEILRMAHGGRPDQVLIDHRKQNVWVANAGDRLLLNKNFWDFVKTTVHLANELRTEGELVRTSHLYKLQSTARTLINPGVDWDIRTKLLGDWSDYMIYHGERVEPVIKGIKRQRADRCSRDLKENVLWSANATVQTVSVDYETMCVKAKEHIDLVDRFHAENTADINNANVGILFYTRMTKLDDSVRALESAATRFIDNMIQAIPEFNHD